MSFNDGKEPGQSAVQGTDSVTSSTRFVPHFAIASFVLALSACATPARMHTEAQLNDVALGCGLSLGELIQDESEKRLLITMRSNPSLPQRACVAQWARRNGLKAVFVDIKYPEG
jgi:hypothetical protein